MKRVWCTAESETLTLLTHCGSLANLYFFSDFWACLHGIQNGILDLECLPAWQLHYKVKLLCHSHGCFVWHRKRDCSCHAYFAGACDSLETGTSFVSTSYGSGDTSFILTLPKYGCSQSYPAWYPVTNPLPVSAILQSCNCGNVFRDECHFYCAC